MNVLDLFSGACGGWSLGFERAGFVTIAACEIDPWRRAQFARNFPGAKLYDDIRSVTAQRLRADGIGTIDVVCGSPPCQDASVANTRGKGVDGERTGLYFEAIRIVREIRPSWCAFENVPGIRNRGVDRVLGELEAAGYAAWPLVVGALDLGAPHIRKRSWVVCADAKTVQRLALPWGEPDGNSARAAALADGEEQSGEPIDGEMEGYMDNIAPDPPLERAITERLGPIAQNWNGGIAGRLGMDDGLPRGMARPLLAAYGDAVLPQITEIIGRAIMRAAA